MMKSALVVVIAFLGACASFSSIGGSPFEKALNLTWTDDPKVESAETEKNALELIYSGNVNGELNPCGCAMNPKGGLDRRLNYLTQTTPRGARLVVDAGNALFAVENSDEPMNRQRARAEAVMKGHQVMGIVYQGVGRLDVVSGLDFLKKIADQNKITLLSANLQNQSGEFVFKTSERTAWGQNQVLLIGLSDDLGLDGFKTIDAQVALNAELKKAQPDDVVVVLSTLGSQRDSQLAQASKRQMIFVGARELHALDIPHHKGPSIVLRAQFQGQQWGVFQFDWKGQASQGWYSPQLGRVFHDRWLALRGEQKDMRERYSRKDRKEEDQRALEASQRLAEYAPMRDPKRSVLYLNRHVDLTERYAEPNQLTPLLKTQ